MPTTTSSDLTLLQPLREACLRVAACRQVEPGESALSGMCVEISLIVRGVFGGELVCGFVGSDRHYWNRLPSGKEVDLTSDQFGGNGYDPVVTGNIVDVPSPLPLDGLVFGQRVVEALSSNVFDDRSGTRL